MNIKSKKTGRVLVAIGSCAFNMYCTASNPHCNSTNYEKSNLLEGFSDT